MILSEVQVERYARQIIIPEIGMDGQKKLLESSVLVLGAGGLGSALLYYLTACGVGNIGVADYDKVDLSNLHRQIIYDIEDIGKKKVLSVREKIKRLNPDINIAIFEEKIEKHNIQKIFSNYEIIVDGLDNFSDKFLVNEYSIKLNKKLVHAGVIGFEGQILTIIPNKSACLKCLFPDKEPLDYRQSCKEIGVLGPCVGVLSTLQAIEVVKLILNIGELYTNRVLKYNALHGKFYEFKISDRNENCSVCSRNTEGLEVRKY